MSLENELSLDNELSPDKLPDLFSTPAPKKTRFKLSVCVNEVFLEHKIAVATMVTGKGDYVLSAKKMIRGAKRFSRIPFSKILVEVQEKPLDADSRRELEEEGFVVCTLPRIAPAQEGKLKSKKFGDQFTKLWLWSMVELDTLVYLDSDAYVIGDITELLTSRLPPSKRIGVTRDFYQDNFNMGVFLLHPNKKDADLLMSYHRGDRPIKYTVEWAEQGFLNAVWEKEWHEIGWRYNAFSILIGSDHWNTHLNNNNISIIHYTVPKPWGSACFQESHAATCRYWTAEVAPRRLMRCSNAVIVDLETSIWSMMEGSSTEDVDHAVKLLTSARRHSKVLFAGIMMELKEKPISNDGREKLQDAGWNICTVEGSSRFDKVSNPSQYARLQLWGMTELKTVVFLDPESYVVGDITELLKGAELPGTKKVGAIADSRGGGKFGTGSLLVRPREEDYQLLMSYKNGGKKMDYDVKRGDEGFLNALWGDEWHDIGPRFGLSVASADTNPAQWKKEREDMRIVRYAPSVSVKDLSPAVAEAYSWRQNELVPKTANGGSPVKLARCANAPTVDHKLSVWSMLEDAEGKEKGGINAAVKLLESARRNIRIPFSPVMMEVASEPIVAEGRKALEEAGWTICTVRLPRNKAKLEMWSMEELDTILFLSVRTIVLKDITTLLTTRLFEQEKLGAVPTARLQTAKDSMFVEQFRADVLLLHPSLVDYKVLEPFKEDSERSDEQILQTVWRRQWYYLGFLNGATTVVAGKRKWWARIRQRIRILWFEDMKPWECDDKSEFQLECTWWKQAGGPKR